MIEAVHTPDEAPVELKADTIVNALGSKRIYLTIQSLPYRLHMWETAVVKKRQILHQQSEQDIMQPMSFK